MPPAAFSTVRFPSVPAESAIPFALVVASMIPEFALTSMVAAAPMPITSAEITPELRITVTVVPPMATPPVPVPSTRPELSSVTPTPRMPPPLALTVPALVTATFWPLMAMLFTLAPVASMVPELLLTLTVVALMANPSAEMGPDVVMVAVSNTPIAVLLKAVALMVPELDVRVKCGRDGAGVAHRGGIDHGDRPARTAGCAYGPETGIGDICAVRAPDRASARAGRFNGAGIGGDGNGLR